MTRAYRESSDEAPRVERKHTLKTKGLLPVQGFMRGDDRSPLYFIVGYVDICVSNDGYIWRKNPNLYEVWVRCEYWEDFGKSEKYNKYNVRTKVTRVGNWVRRIPTILLGEWQEMRVQI